MAFLHVIHGVNQGARFELDDAPMTIGRDATNQIQLRDPQVSRFHAEILQSDSEYHFRDLDSSNGSFLNGKRATEHALISGDQLLFGDTILEFADSSEDSRRSAEQSVQIIMEPGDDASRIVQSLRPENWQSRESSTRKPGEADSTDRRMVDALGNLRIMYRTALAVSHTLDVDQLLKRIMELIFEWVEIDRGCIMLASPETGKLEPAAFESRAGQAGADEIQISRTILDYVVEKNEGVLTSNAQEDERFSDAASIMQQGIREAICVPMQARYTMVGVIYIDTITPPQDVLLRGMKAKKLTPEHLQLMVSIAHQAALAVEDTRYYSAMVNSERLAAVGQTIAVMAHHIKNILQGMEGGGFLIREGLTQHDETMIRQGWTFVEKNQARIAKVVWDMLTYSKAREPELVPGDLNQVVTEVVDLMRARAGEYGVRLEFRPEETLPTTTFDAEDIHGAVLNVVTNAIDAAADVENGRVIVETSSERRADSVSILVTDNGSGIPQEQMEKIFTLFISEKRSRGTGLGLPVAQKIFHEHGGDVTVDSSPGEGSRFKMTLPIRHAANNGDDPRWAPTSPLE